MNDYMRLVSKQWYEWYFWVVVASSAFVAIACILLIMLPQLQAYAHGAHIYTLLGLSMVHLIYSASVFPFLKKSHQPLGVLLGVLMFGLITLAGLDQTTQPAIIAYFIIAWTTASFFNGMFGTPLLLGTPFLVALYVLAQVHFSISLADWPWWILLGCSIMAALIGLPFWRRHYVGPQQDEIDRLSTMLHSDQQQTLILLESITDGVVVTDAQGVITTINSGAIGMIGGTKQQYVGQNVHAHIQLYSQNGNNVATDQSPFMRVLTNKHYTSGTYRTAANGHGKVISLLVSPIITPDSHAFAGIIAIMRDISKEYAIEQERINFVTTASHEMRTPLATVEGYLSLALRQKIDGMSSKELRAYLEHSYAAVQHLSQLFSDLLTTSQAEQGALSSSPQNINMRSFLEQAAKSYAPKSTIPITFTVQDSRADYTVFADPTRLGQVIGNLLDNAIKFTPSGSITVHLARTESNVQFSVSDTGVGVPAGDINKLFKKFSRLDNSATRTTGGTGLGLFIAKEIIEFYGGSITVQSEEGKGSTFVVTMPLADVRTV